MLTILSRIKLFIVLIPLAAAAEPSCKMPIDVSDRIGIAQIFDYSITDPNVRSHLGLTRDYLWGADQSKTASPGLHSSIYLPNDRDASRSNGFMCNGYNHTTSTCQSYSFMDQFYLSSHPEWVTYNSATSPMVEYIYGVDPTAWTLTPLDISNPQVRDYIYSSTVSKLTRPVSGIAMDNVEADNIFHRYGNKVNGQLVKRYTGAAVDSTYFNDVLGWMNYATARSHADGLCSSGNNYPHLDNISGYVAISQALDISVDEMGFTRNCAPMYLDSNWKSYMGAFQQIGASRGFVVIDQVCPTLSQFNNTNISWSIANYLLVKGNHSYLAMVPSTSGYGQFFDFPQLHIPTGSPTEPMQNNGSLYWRHFETAFAIVNPSSTQSFTYSLGTSRWLDFAGSIHTGTLTLGPGTAQVLRPVNLASTWTQVNATLSGDPVNASVPFIESHDSLNSEHEIKQVIPLDPSKTWEYSVDVLPKGRSAVRLYMQNLTGYTAGMIATECTLTGTGSARTWAVSAGQVLSSSSTLLADGWYRCSLRGHPTTASPGFNVVLETVSAGSDLYIGDGASGVVLRNASLTPVAHPWYLQSWRLTGGAQAFGTDPTAGTFIESKDAAPVVHHLYQYLTVNPAKPWSLSVDVHATSGTDSLFMYMANVNDESNGSISMSCKLDGTTTSRAGTDGLLISTTSVSLGDGWYRCTLNGRPSTSGASIYFGFELSNGSTTSYTGNGVNGLQMKNISFNPL